MTNFIVEEEDMNFLTMKAFLEFLCLLQTEKELVSISIPTCLLHAFPDCCVFK